MISSVPCSRVSVPHRVVVALVREHDADVGQGRLDQHAGDVAVSELALQRLDVVDLDDAGGLGRVHRRPDVALAGKHGLPVVPELDEGLVDAAVVAPVLDQDLRPAGDLAAEPDRPAVGVGRRQRELPQRQPESAAQLLADPARVLVGQHRRDALRRALADRADDRLGAVARHRAGVAEAEVHVLVPVDVGEARPVRLVDVDRELTRPAHHPVHGHAVQQRAARALEDLERAGVSLAERRQLAAHQLAQPGAVDLAHRRIVWSYRLAAKKSSSSALDSSDKRPDSTSGLWFRAAEAGAS